MLKEKLNTLAIVDNQLKTIEHNVNAAVNAGVANRNDLLQVNLKRNELKSSRITVENSITICRNMLSQSMGLGIDSIDVACSIAEQMPQPPSNLYTSARDAVQQTSEYQLLQQNVKAQKLQYKMSVGKNMPTVSVGGMYSYNNLMDKSQNSLIGLATVSIPISNWIGGSHNMKRQKNEVRNAENSLKDNGELLVINIKNKWNALNEAYKQIEISQNSIGQSKENLRLHTDYYNAGTCTMSDLLEAQTMFQQSKDRFVENVTQYEIRKTEYLQSIGR
jgi:outer membrane protein TolC